MTSDENKNLAKVPLQDLDGVLDIKSMASSAVDVTDFEALAGYIKLPSGLDIPNRSFTPDGQFLDFYPEFVVTEEQDRMIETCIKQVFPNLKGVRIYQSAPKPKQTNIPLYDWSAN